jgi:hypothetical protein
VVAFLKRVDIERLVTTVVEALDPETKERLSKAVVGALLLHQNVPIPEVSDRTVACDCCMGLMRCIDLLAPLTRITNIPNPVSAVLRFVTGANRIIEGQAVYLRLRTLLEAAVAELETLDHEDGEEVMAGIQRVIAAIQEGLATFASWVEATQQQSPGLDVGVPEIEYVKDSLMNFTEFDEQEWIEVREQGLYRLRSCVTLLSATVNAEPVSRCGSDFLQRIMACCRRS